MGLESHGFTGRFAWVLPVICNRNTYTLLSALRKAVPHVLRPNFITSYMTPSPCTFAQLSVEA